MRQEEANFFGTIDRGYGRIEAMFADMERDGKVTVDAAKAADLYQTYGVPPELVEIARRGAQLCLRLGGFPQRDGSQLTPAAKRSRKRCSRPGRWRPSSGRFTSPSFVGYETIEADAVIKGIVAQEQLVDRVGRNRPRSTDYRRARPHPVLWRVGRPGG